MMTDLVSVFAAAAARYGDRAALVDKTGSATFAELMSRAAARPAGSARAIGCWSPCLLVPTCSQHLPGPG